ncbi:MAG: SpoIIIAH-like family protein [Lachnospiraceae bacterium]|nr:SpoIIIAH-like family protein [Lachnospiraceae bacterium]
MNRIFKKNQLIITSLAIMIAVAGYLNFSGKEISMLTDHQETMVQSVNDELDIPEGEIGEAVLTSASIESYVANARLNREQTHAKAKENLESIINNTSIDQSQKQDAIDTLANLSDRMAKQTAAEELLSSKGFLHSVVTISDETVDVVVANQDLSAVSRAQIEDAVSRTCSCDLDQIVITKMKTED